MVWVCEEWICGRRAQWVSAAETVDAPDTATPMWVFPALALAFAAELLVSDDTVMMTAVPVVRVTAGPDVVRSV